MMINGESAGQNLLKNWNNNPTVTAAKTSPYIQTQIQDQDSDLVTTVTDDWLLSTKPE